MMKMLIEFDEEKVKRDGRYDIHDLYKFVDDAFGLFDIAKDENGLYVGGAFEVYGGIVAGFKKREWFLTYVKRWIWYTDLNGQCSEEDLVVFYKERGLIS